MPKKTLPTYSICNLAEKPQATSDLIADHFAHYLSLHPNLHFPHKHSFYHLVYFTKGSGHHSIDFIQYPVEPGQIYFMIPGQVHTWDFKGAPDGFIINFSESYLQALVANPRYLDQFTFFLGIANEQVINIPTEGSATLAQMLETIVDEAKASKTLKDDYIRAALVQMFIYVSRFTAEASAPQHPYNSLLLRNFQKLIELHYKEKKLTKEYAAMLYVTPNHLNALCKDITGNAAGELIRNRVLLEAKRLLTNAEMTVAEIATELDFADNSYFSKFFKKAVGVTPESFRKQFVKQQ
jgi:AraC-like DNA-binding protein